MHISIYFVAVALALTQEMLAHPVLVTPEYRTIHVPGVMRRARSLPPAPAGLDLLSALPLESLLGTGSPLAGDGGGDSDGSEESAGSGGYEPADGVGTGGADSSGGTEDPSTANDDAANGSDTAPPAKKTNHRE